MLTGLPHTPSSLHTKPDCSSDTYPNAERRSTMASRICAFAGLPIGCGTPLPGSSRQIDSAR